MRLSRIIRSLKVFDVVPGLSPGTAYRDPGGDLLSQYLAVLVPSALVGLTTEFGMGSGVAPPEKPPGKSINKRILQRQTPEGSNDKAKPHDQLVQVRSTP